MLAYDGITLRLDGFGHWLDKFVLFWFLALGVLWFMAMALELGRFLVVLLQVLWFKA